MQPGQPSRTALGAAAHRAAHQLIEGGRVFADPLAVSILGWPPEALQDKAAADPSQRAMRLFIAARSRFAEEQLAAAVARGVRQYVVLGAGLDTFAHRNPFEAEGLEVFEVDHPLTQAWKREQLTRAGLKSSSLVFAAVDFERETLAQGLAAAGFDADRPAFFSWLGVILYLTREAVFETLAYVAARPPGSQIVFDYGEPVSSYPPDQRPFHQARLDRMAALGEPWITRFEPEVLARDLGALGFGEIEDLGPREIGRRFYGAPGRDGPGGHLMRAAV
jgi:methyltransferase (TIGR00027 family)